MTAEVIGEAQVLITADFSTFDDELRSKLTAAARRAGNDAERALKRSGDRAGKGFADGVSKAANSQKTLDSIRASIERLEAAAVRAGNTQVDSANRVARAEAALAKVKRTTSLVTIDGAEKIVAAEQKVAKAKRDAARADTVALNSAKALSTARAKLAAEGARAGDAFGDELTKAVNRSSRRAGDDGGNFFANAFRTAASRAIGQGLFTALIASAGTLVTAASPLSTVLGGAAAAVVALGAAIATASGSALSLIGVLGSLGLAAGTLAVGFSGVGDAMKAQSAAQEELARTGEISAATQEKLDAALKRLAPSAAAVVRQLGAMAPAWQAVQRSVQERLFAGVSTALANLGNRYLPILTQQLGTAATTLNQTALGFARFLNTSTRASQINRIFTGLNGILRTLLGPATAISGAFLNLFEASLPFAERLADVLADLTRSFAGFLNQAVASGSFNTFMETAMQLAGNLFQLLGNIGSIIGSVFAAGTATGGNLLVILRDLTGQFAQFLKSAEGQAALANFFELVATSGQILVGVFRTLQPALSGISSLFAALQPALQALGTALIPVVASLSSTLGAAFTQLGPVLANLVTSLTPIVALLGTALVGALQVLLPAIAQLIAGLTPLITTVLNVAVTLLQQLLNAALPLVPVIVQVATAIATGLTGSLQMLLPVIVQAGTNLLALVQALLPLVPSLLQLIPPAVQLSQAFLQMLIALQPLTTAILTTLIELIIQLTPAIMAVIPFIVQMITSFANLITTLTRVITTVVNFAVQVQASFNAARDAAVSAIAAMVTGVVNSISSLVQSGQDLFNTFKDNVVNIASELGSGVISAIESGLSGLAGAFRAPFDAAKRGVESALSAIIGAVEGAVGRISGLISKISGAIGKLKVPGLGSIDIPGLKDGGVVRGKGSFGTLRRVGEYGRAEAVIPLTKPKRAKELMDSTGLSALASASSGKSKTVEIPISVAGSVVDYEALTAHIESVLRRFGLTPSLGIVTAGGAL